jgi:hypothetical protein
VTLTSTQGKVTADYTYSCEASGDATVVTPAADCTTRGVFLNLAAPLLRYVVRRTDGGQLSELRRVIEG